MWNWFRGMLGLGTDDDVNVGAIFDDHQIDPAFAYEPMNIYHETVVDLTSMSQSNADHFTDPAYASEVGNLYHNTTFEESLIISSGTTFDSSDSFGGCRGIDTGFPFDFGGGLATLSVSVVISEHLSPWKGDKCDGRDDKLGAIADQ